MFSDAAHIYLTRLKEEIDKNKLIKTLSVHVGEQITNQTLNKPYTVELRIENGSMKPTGSWIFNDNNFVLNIGGYVTTVAPNTEDVVHDNLVLIDTIIHANKAIKKDAAMDFIIIDENTYSYRQGELNRANETDMENKRFKKYTQTSSLNWNISIWEIECYEDNN